jgi:hypothetical protein
MFGMDRRKLLAGVYEACLPMIKIHTHDPFLTSML